MQYSMPLCLSALTLLLLVALFSAADAVLQTSQRNALVQIYNALNGPSWNPSWPVSNSAVDPCNWSGVTCDASSTTLLQLRLVGITGTSGQLADVFNAFPNIVLLAIVDIQCGGVLPASLGSATSLTSLEIGITQIGGPIPSGYSSLTNLKSISLYKLSLNSTIPDMFGSMTALQTVNINNIPFGSGAFPASLKSLSSLQSITIQDASMTGSLPYSSSWASNLVTLDLSRNNFNGAYPDGMGQMTKLQSLVLDTNVNLNGALPSAWSTLTALTKLSMFNAGNVQTGPLPASWSALTALTYLSLSGCYLTAVPNNLQLLTALQVLDLSTNSIASIAANTFENLTTVTELYLQANGLQGGIPASVFKMKSLRIFKMWNNQMNGLFAGNFSALPNLQLIDAGGNSFTGIDPSFCGATGLQTFLISNNPNMVGTIPACVNTMTTLNVVDISWAGFSGALNWNNLTNLHELTLNNLASLGGYVDLGAMSALTAFSASSSPQINFRGDVACARSWSWCNVAGTSMCGSLSGGTCRCQNLPICTTTTYTSTSTVASTSSSSSSSSAVISSSSSVAPAASSTSSVASSTQLISSSSSSTPSSSSSSTGTSASSTVTSTSAARPLILTVASSRNAGTATPTPDIGGVAGASSNSTVTAIAGAAAAGGVLLLLSSGGFWLYRRKARRANAHQLKNFDPASPVNKNNYAIYQPADMQTILSGTIYSMLGMNTQSTSATSNNLLGNTTDVTAMITQTQVSVTDFSFTPDRP